jgi:hypothetical protein
MFADSPAAAPDLVRGPWMEYGQVEGWHPCKVGRRSGMGAQFRELGSICARVRLCIRFDSILAVQGEPTQ